MLLRELFEAPTKIAAFALGRLNPATTGHELLVNAIKKAPGDSFLFLTDRAPKLPTDPLSSEEKLDWARKSFDGISVGTAKTVLTAADRLYKMGYREVTFLEGEPKLFKLLKQYNGVEKEMHNFTFDKINYVQLQRDPDAEDASGMSASKLRQTVVDNNFEAFKKGVTQNAQPYAEQMFKKLQGIMGVDSVEEAVSTEVAAPEKIKVMKPINPPKPPDATIPKTRDGHTKNDGTTYVQDKYDDKLMHVSDGGGTYTFNGSRMIKWQTPRIKGLKFIYDYVKNKIYLDAHNTVDLKDGNVGLDQLAAYDMKGNLIPGSGAISVGAGGLKMGLDKDKLSIDYRIADGLSVHVTGNRNNKPSPEAKKYLKDMVAKVKAGEEIAFADSMAKFKDLGAKVQFRMSGKAVPFKQGLAKLKAVSKAMTSKES